MHNTTNSQQSQWAREEGRRFCHPGVTALSRTADGSLKQVMHSPGAQASLWARDCSRGRRANGAGSSSTSPAFKPEVGTQQTASPTPAGCLGAQHRRFPHSGPWTTVPVAFALPWPCSVCVCRRAHSVLCGPVCTRGHACLWGVGDQRLLLAHDCSSL